MTNEPQMTQNRRASDDPSYSEMEALATRAAQKALTDLFDMFGADISTHEGRRAVRENWTWLTDTRMGTQFIRRTTWGAAITAFIGAILAGLAWAVTKGIAAVASAGNAVLR